MHHFRKKPPSSMSVANSPPSTPTLPMVEYIKQELATFHPWVKDRRALAASSSAIALSIAFPSCDPSNTVLDEPESSKESGWRTAYGAAKIAVEISNASSDMFLPLKAVVGALSVLIKNYDQTDVNADQIREVEKRVQSLSEVLTAPVRDRDGEEKTRREAIRRKLAGIVAKLKPLSKQRGVKRFLKSDDHANILNGFVQDLGYAVTDYQTSLQQSIHNDNKRIDEKTQGIYETTKEIHETTKRIDEATKKFDDTAQNTIEVADYELLEKLNPIYNAGYKAGHHDTCLRGTRESVLDGIIRWAEDLQDRPVFWLNGLAGTGKSTIAQTFSEIVAKTGILGASFFCSREYLDRKDLKNIFPTLAYQLACRYPAFRKHIIRVVKQDPSVAQNSLISQLKDLIVDPLSSTNISCVIVIDALDECVDDQPASAILSVLGRHIKELTSVKFFITGRPEPRIRTGFRLRLLKPLTQIFRLHEVKPSDVDGDIRLYFQEKLTAISKQRSNFDVSDPWPCDRDLVALTKKSSGLFIFASTLARFIESEHHEPNERLQLIVASSDSTVHEGRAGIDPLYTQVLMLAFSNVKEDKAFASLRRVLGAVVLSFNPLSREQIAKLLGITPFLITTTLRHLHSVLLVSNDDSKEIRVFHKSFPDFLQDPDRCSDPKFFINSPVHHGDIALDCLELLKELKSNPCGLPNFVMNRDVADLPELLEEKVESATRYACGYWAMHIRSAPTTNDYATRLISSAIEFFENNAVSWIEIMSLANQLESVVHSIYSLLDWLGTVDASVSGLRSLAEDCLRFTMYFFHLIEQSASHIYNSALPLSPRSSAFLSRTLSRKTAIIGFHGRSDAWGFVVRTITPSSKSSTCTATFGHKIAVACSDSTLGIYDSVTGVLRSTLRLLDPAQAIGGSPDGSMLFCAHTNPSITAWDIQTGGLIHTFTLEQNAEDIAVSSKGRYIACGLTDGSVEVWEVETKTEAAAIWAGQPVTCYCWLDPEERFAVSTAASVDIRDIAAGTLLRSFTIRYPVDRMVYSQKSNQLAVMASSGSGSAMTIINPRTAISTASQWIHQRFSCFAFSQTSEELVCGMETHGLQQFNLSTRRFKRTKFPDTITSVSPLQNGTVVANVVGSGIQLLSLDERHAPSQQPTISPLTVRVLDDGRVVAIFPTSRDHIVLLESVTISPLLRIPIQNTGLASTDHTILFASHENLMAAYYFEEGNRGFLQLWMFHDQVPRWTAEVKSGAPAIGQISPSGLLLVTFHPTDVTGRLCAWDARNGQPRGQPMEHIPSPLEIEFLEDTELFLHYDTFCATCIIDSQGLGGYREVPLFLSTRRSQEKRYFDVDDTHEWVVKGSKRICWIPPGYIGSTQPSYYWAGYSLIMVGQDGVLRGLIF